MTTGINLPDIFTSQALANIENDPIINWSDDKKNDFCSTLKLRVEDAIAVQRNLAGILFAEGKRLFFISQNKPQPEDIRFNFHVESRKGNRILELRGFLKSRGSHVAETVEGLTDTEMKAILLDQANVLIEHLPTRRKVAEIIGPDVSRGLGRIREIDKEVKALEKAADEIITLVNLEADDFAEMKGREIKAELIRRRDEKAGMILKAVALRSESSTLEAFCNKAMYSGVKELEDEIMGIIKDLLERARSYPQLLRRTTEKIKFGDSEIAETLLKEFEDNEVALEERITTRLSAIVEAIQTRVQNTRTQLTEG